MDSKVCDKMKWLDGYGWNTFDESGQTGYIKFGFLVPVWAMYDVKDGKIVAVTASSAELRQWATDNILGGSIYEEVIQQRVVASSGEVISQVTATLGQQRREAVA